jgi:Na+-transporting NADH:ubiquinone oxidoreductase subunit D
VFLEGLWRNNPIFGMILGLCSTLAVTNLMANALVMSLAVTAALVASSAIISALRGVIPERVRMITYMLIISSVVITVDMFLRIYVPEVSRSLGPYVALIITNCLLMGRAEAFANANPVGISVVDALGVGLGYGFSLMVLAVFRELLGFGSLFGVRILPAAVTPIGLLSIPPGAFFALGIYILVINTVRRRRTRP